MSYDIRMWQVAFPVTCSDLAHDSVYGNDRGQHPRGEDTPVPLLARVAAGEEIGISRAGKPVARLVPIREQRIVRKPGRDEGRIWMADDFDAPLPPEIQSQFE